VHNSTLVSFQSVHLKPARISKFVALIVLVLVAMETLSLAEWTLFPHIPANWRFFASLDADFFGVVLPLSPLLLLLTLYAWIFESARLSERYSQRFQRAFGAMVRARDRLLRWIVGDHPSISGETQFFGHSRVWLLVAVCSGVLIAYTPYRADLNPSQSPVGIDTPLYIGWIDQMLTGSIGQAVAYAFGIANHGSRPFLLCSSALELWLPELARFRALSTCQRSSLRY